MSTMNYYGEPPQPQFQPKYNRFLSGTTEFMESNSAISNFAFLILVVVAFMICIQMGIAFIEYIFYPKTDVRLIRGMIEANSQVEIIQDPSQIGSKTIYRSADERAGLEFTYSTWIFVEGMTTEVGDLAHVFHKGERNFASTEFEVGGQEIPKGMNYPNNGPGVYLRKTAGDNADAAEMDQADMVVVMNTFPDETNSLQSNHIVEQVDIGNIPLHNWVLVTVVVRGRNLDVYINGNIAKRHILTGVPKQNYGNIYAGSNGGFRGKLSNLTYYNEAIGTREIYNTLRLGPDMRMTNNANLLNKNFDYLSLGWFLGRGQDSA